MRFASSSCAMDSVEVTSTHSSEFDGSSVVGDESDPASAYVERIRVDRKKLEEMLQETDIKASTSADGFFKKVMETTDTIISWPTKLKANVKSKKAKVMKYGTLVMRDPHVKVCGSSEAVGKARESILEVLDTKRNRVTMKMDVSFTDHSYIIGKGGHNIQQVMDNTGCHIHFPDSNRNSHMDKSNQVSIAGTPSGVESARNQIRNLSRCGMKYVQELLPMVVSFELPLNLALPSALDPSSMALQGILKSHGITVTFRPLHNSLTLVVVVKGSRRYVDRLRQGLLVLVEYLTGGTRTQVGLVTLSMEIAPHHHGFVMGHGNSNVLQIARQTGCVITFPDPVAVANQPPSVLPTFLGLGQQTCPQGRPPVGIPSKSTVQITGNFDAVHNAWLELMDRLPLVLMFDLKENQAVDMLAVYKLMDHMNVHISVKPKPKRNSRSAVVRCPERDSRLLFEVRRIILSLDTDELGSPSPSFIDKISYSAAKPSPKGSMMPDPTWWEIQAASQHHAAAAAAASRQQQHQQQQLFLSGLLAGNPFIGHPQPMAGPQQQQQQAALLPLLLGQLFQGPRSGLFDPSVVSSLTSRPSVCIPPSETLPSPNHSSSYGLSSGAHSYPGSQGSHMDSGYGFSLHDEGHLSTSDEVTSCHTWEDSMNDMEGKEPWKKSHEHGSPPSGNQRSLEEIWADSPMFEYQRGMAPVGCERKVSFGSPLPHLDYERRKLLATKAMQEHVGCTKRVPSSTWSGFGFSKSMPESMVKGQLQQNGTGTTSGRQAKLEETKVCSSIDQATPSQVWDNGVDDCLGAAGRAMVNDSDNGRHSAHNLDGPFSASNFFEYVGARRKPRDNSCMDIPHLFSHLGLGKYVDIFQRNEIDLQTFLCMSDCDLQQLSIPYAARKKMLLAISDMNSAGLSAFSRNMSPGPNTEYLSDHLCRLSLASDAPKRCCPPGFRSTSHHQQDL